eukprot:CAMPEP_0176002516 /NCGR_PEP_ID=MMETSP0120_2-20121206/686_1 /TAXON_ID=160619 /ORGANISM="Kryptoperidinium foliaceum, Strain CCMP 1326" /LENGTH=221 /DNA_ID=CAMNT_0017335105 /DNA_START=133 /DNA_END=798 /DNA_ORIENTATION=-
MIATQRNEAQHSMELLPPKLLLSDSYATADTDTTSVSEFSDEYEPVSVPPFSTGAFRLDDFMEEDCNDDDTLSVITRQTSLIEYEEESAGSLPPQEIVILNEDALEQNETVGDIQQRLKIAETLARSYKEKAESTEELTDALQEHLRQAQDYAESALADRDELLRHVEAMHEEERNRLNQSLMIKVAMASSLFYYLCGGSSAFLVGSVGLNLLSDAWNTLS